MKDFIQFNLLMVFPRLWLGRWAPLNRWHPFHRSLDPAQGQLQDPGGQQQATGQTDDKAVLQSNGLSHLKNGPGGKKSCQHQAHDPKQERHETPQGYPPVIIAALGPGHADPLLAAGDVLPTTRCTDFSFRADGVAREQPGPPFHFSAAMRTIFRYKTAHMKPFLPLFPDLRA